MAIEHRRNYAAVEGAVDIFRVAFTDVKGNLAAAKYEANEAAIGLISNVSAFADVSDAEATIRSAFEHLSRHREYEFFETVTNDQIKKYDWLGPVVRSVAARAPLYAVRSFSHYNQMAGAEEVLRTAVDSLMPRKKDYDVLNAVIVVAPVLCTSEWGRTALRMVAKTNPGPFLDKFSDSQREFGPDAILFADSFALEFAVTDAWSFYEYIGKIPQNDVARIEKFLVFASEKMVPEDLLRRLSDWSMRVPTKTLPRYQELLQKVGDRLAPQGRLKHKVLFQAAPEWLDIKMRESVAVASAKDILEAAQNLC